MAEHCYHCGAVIGSTGRPCAVHNPSEADRAVAMDEHTRMWSDEITGSITAGGQTGHEPHDDGSPRWKNEVG